MSEPADVPYPAIPDASDAELLVVQVLRVLEPGGARAVTELPADIEWQLPIIQVTEVPGGAQEAPNLDTAVIDYDAYAGNRAEAKGVAAAARQLLLYCAGFRYDAGPGGPRMWVSRVVEVRRPTLLPYDDASDIRRFGGSARLSLRYTSP